MSEVPQPLHALPQGYRLQEYELVRVLGFGGFGMTYLGFDHNLDKAVAIKEYLPSDIAIRTADRSVAPQASNFRGDFQWGLERFLGEARTLARFDHRHIIKVYRFFEAHGTGYIVMEYAEGETLSAHLERKGPLSEAELKAILYPLLDGLEVVHGADFLHRDIKPGNIVLRDVDGSPVLLDFGAARQAVGAKSRSVTSIVTPGYAPIEQYSTRGRQGAWTDLYALGGVCYRALTGDVPEDATDRMRDDPLVPVAQRCAGRVSEAFLSAVDWALSVDEGARPQNVGAWREAMEVEMAAEVVDDVPSVKRVEKEAAGQELASDAAAVEKEAVDDAPSVKRVEQETPPLERPKKPFFRRLAVVLGVVALLVGGVMYVNHAAEQRREQAALEKQRQEQAALEKQRQEQAALEKQRQEQAALEKQRQEQAALEKQRREQAALEKQRQEQAALEKQRREQVALEKQRREQAALEKQRQEQTALEKQRREQAALEKQRREPQRQEQAFVAEVGRKPHPRGRYRGETDLYIAASLNLPVLIRSLIAQGAEVNVKGNDGNTPLHVAAWKDASAMVKVLLENGADVNAKGKSGETPLHVAAEEDASATAAVLLENGAEVNAKDNDGKTPLRVAAWKNASATAAVLLENGAEVNAQNNEGWTPLHVVAFEDTSAVVKVLLDNGADANTRDNEGRTLLHWAARADASAMVKVLLDNGADANTRDNEGRTPLHWAAYVSSDYPPKEWPYWAVMAKDASATAVLLLENGADVNAKDNDGYTPLYWAERYDAVKTAEVLYQYDARR